MKWPKSCSKKRVGNGKYRSDQDPGRTSRNSTEEARENKQPDLWIWGRTIWSKRPKNKTTTTSPNPEGNKKTKHQVKERRDCRKQWMKGSIEKRERFNRPKKYLARLQRIEDPWIQPKKRKRASTLLYLYIDLLRFVKGLITKEKSRTVQVSKWEVEYHLTTIYTNNHRPE